MIGTMKKALEYAMAKSEDPPKIKKNVEEYMAAAGCDRRYKFKWRAWAGNAKYTSAGIFEYHGRMYYFNKTEDKLVLEYHRIP